VKCEGFQHWLLQTPAGVVRCHCCRCLCLCNLLLSAQAPSRLPPAPPPVPAPQKNHLSGLQRRLLKISFWNQDQLQQVHTKSIYICLCSL
jgi:hypothetical protein